MAKATVEEALDAIRRGEMVILVDDEERENEGDLVVAAEKCTADDINFMATHGRGLICLTLTQDRLRELDLPMMVEDNTASFGTAFTVSIEAREGVTTGISAADRAHTIQVAIDKNSKSWDIVRPGHIFPLRARDGGVLERTGQTEGSVDLARLAGLNPSGVICEILNEDGTMARMPDLEVFAEKHGLLIVTVADIIEYRLARETLVEKVMEAPYPNEYSDGWTLHCYKDIVDGGEHFVFTLGDVSDEAGPALVRVQHQCTIGDVFRGTDCNCGWQLHGSMEMIAKEGRGVLVYLHKHEHTRFHAVQKYVLNEKRDVTDGMTGEEYEKYLNRPKPESRTFGVGAQILIDQGVRRMRILNNFQTKLVGLESYGLEVLEMVQIEKPRYIRERKG